MAKVGSERWRALLGLALAHEANTSLAYAVAFHRAFIREWSEHKRASEGKWQTWRGAAELEIAAFESRLMKTQARLDLQSQPSGAQVHINGVVLNAVTTSPLLAYLPAGQQRVTLAHSPRDPRVLSVLLE